ncbi:MAG TPA: clostripain-related cysteine peptidase [Candidatus Limnocylindria bacterium]|nr:clostripain-related cysteine peptidase [Candidatus Limnocylindria bacterium]
MPKRWTFIVYLAGDNNLEQYGLVDLLEMKAVGSTADVDVVAQFDGMEDGGTRRYHLTADRELADDVVDELAEVNTGDPDALLDLVSWAMAEYPAERTALVLWNHGSGWRDEDIYRLDGGPALDPEQPRSLVRGAGEAGIRRSLFKTSIASVLDYPAEVRGILFDDTSKDFLDSRELKRVVERMVAARGGRKLDLIGFDACLMSTIEVGFQIRDAFEVMVGSQEIEPGDGWPYGRILAALAAEPAAGPEELGRMVVEAYVAELGARDRGAAVTQSAVRLGQMAETTVRVGRLADALTASLERPSFSRQLLAVLRGVQKFRDRDCVDLLHLCRLLGGARGAGRDAPSALRDASVDGVADAALDLAALFEPQAVSSVVPWARFSGGALKAAGGLSIYLPLMGAVSPAYRNLDFAASSTWPRFLDSFAGPAP